MSTVQFLRTVRVGSFVADFVLPLASFDGATLSFMGTSQNVPDTLVFHFEAGADSATLDMPVVLQMQAMLADRNLDMSVVLQRQALFVVRNLDRPVVLLRQVSRSRQVSQSCFFSIEDVSFGPFNFDDISAVWTVLLANSAHHLSRIPCLFRVLMTPSLTRLQGQMSCTCWFHLHYLCHCHCPPGMCLSCTSEGEFATEESNLHNPFPFVLVTLHCSRCTVFSQSILRLLWANSVQHLSICPIFSSVMTPITLARMARCPAHFGSTYNECCPVRMSWKVLLVVFHRNTNTPRRHNNRTGTSGT